MTMAWLSSSGLMPPKLPLCQNRGSTRKTWFGRGSPRANSALISTVYARNSKSSAWNTGSAEQWPAAPELGRRPSGYGGEQVPRLTSGGGLRPRIKLGASKKPELPQLAGDKERQDEVHAGEVAFPAGCGSGDCRLVRHRRSESPVAFPDSYT